MHETTLTLSYSSPETAAVIERAIGQEAGDIASDRSRATVSRSADTVVISIVAEDLVSLRAGHNTWLGLVEVAEKTVAAVE